MCTIAGLVLIFHAFRMNCNTTKLSHEVARNDCITADLHAHSCAAVKMGTGEKSHSSSLPQGATLNL